MDTAFIAIDYIYDILNQRDHVIEPLNRAIRVAREKGWLVVFVNVGFDPTYVDCPAHSLLFGPVRQAHRLTLGQKGTQLHKDIQTHPSDIICTKPRVSAFYGTRLEAVLRAQNVKRLFIGGVSTTWCVQSSARDAHDRDYETFVVEDICAAGSPQEHDMSIHMLQTIARIVRIADLERF